MCARQADAIIEAFKEENVKYTELDTNNESVRDEMREKCENAGLSPYCSGPVVDVYGTIIGYSSDVAYDEMVRQIFEVIDSHK